MNTVSESDLCRLLGFHLEIFTKGVKIGYQNIRGANKNQGGQITQSLSIGVNFKFPRGAKKNQGGTCPPTK